MADVLRVITRLNVGGPTQQAILLTAALGRSGWTTALVAGRVDPSEGDMSDLAHASGVAPITLRHLHNRGWPGEDLAAAVALFGLFRRRRPDIVHLHLLKARLLGGVAARLAGVPLVVETFHGTLFAEYYRPSLSRVLVWVERTLARMMDGVIAVSEAVAEELRRRQIAPPEKITVIPLGLPLQRFLLAGERGGLRRELGIPEDAPVIGTVGRLVPVKGLAYFVDAAAAIGRQAPAARFVVVGDGPERPRLAEQVRKAALVGQVHFVGWRRDLERVYPDLDVVMLTSLNEGTPVSLIEAMAAGRAVVATRVGGVPDVVSDGVTGLLVPSRNPAALADAALRLLGDPALRRRLGQAARAAVYPRFDAARLTADMDAYYRQLMARRPVAAAHSR